MIVFIVVATIVFSAGLVRARSLNLSHLIAATLLFPIIGAYVLTDEGRASIRPAILMTCGLGTFAIAYSVHGHIFPIRRAIAVDSTTSPRFAVTRGFVYLGVLTHFVRGGLPILSTNPELARLNFASSGLLGVPGRLYLFGLPFVLGLTAWEARSRGVSLWRYRAFQICFLIFTLSRAVSGFKSAFLEVLLVLALILLTAPIAPSLRRTVALLSVPLAVSLIAAYAIGTTYATYEAASGGSRQAFVDRFTSEAAVSTVVVLSDSVPRYDAGPAVFNDFQYYSRSYFHVGPGYPFAFERVVSASLVGGSPTDPYLGPVTTGAFADIYYDAGMWPALAGMVGLGAIAAWLVNVARSSEARPLRYMLAFAGAMAMYEYLTKGSLAYNSMNFCAIAILLAILARGELLVRGETVPSRPRRASTCPTHQDEVARST